MSVKTYCDICDSLKRGYAVSVKMARFWKGKEEAPQNKYYGAET